ncbi:unnamed protein product [Calypogeia fissa]
MKLFSRSADELKKEFFGMDLPKVGIGPEKNYADDILMMVDVGLPPPFLTQEQQAAQARDPNLVKLTGGRKNLGVYEGQLIERQREALAAWKQTDNYRDAYLKKKKRKRRRPEWIPLSREYQFDAIMKHTDPSLLGKPEPPPAKPLDPYRSSEYTKETKKDPTIPRHQVQKSAYKSVEYQKACPVPPIPYPGVPLGNSPEEGPWIEVIDCMWNSIWVTLKDLDLDEAVKREEFFGYDRNSDKIA